MQGSTCCTIALDLASLFFSGKLQSCILEAPACGLEPHIFGHTTQYWLIFFSPKQDRKDF